MPQEFGLHRLASPELKRLLRALHRDVFVSPITRSSLIEHAFGHIEADLDLVVGRDVAGAKAVVIAALAEREGARMQLASLSYCGAPAPGSRSRDLLDQVREFVAGATKSVHLYGLRVGDDRGLLRTLGSLISGRDVSVRVVFDCGDDEASIAEARAFVAKSLGESARPKFEGYVCRSRKLRARVVVIDGSKALLTSGDFAASEDDGYLDLGAVLSDDSYIQALETEWNRMRDAEIVIAI